MVWRSALASVGQSIDCLDCNKPLQFVPQGYPLVFRCENAHLLTIWDLLDHEVPGGTKVQGGHPASTLRNWQERARIFRVLCGRALDEGHVLLAADLMETATRIERWISSLEMLLARMEASTSRPWARRVEAPGAPHPKAG